MDGPGRAHRLTLTAKLAFGEIYIGKIILKGYRIVGTGFYADAATDTGIGTCFLCGRSLVRITAGHKLTHSARALGTKLYKGFGACFYTLAARHALFLIHHRKTGCRIHRKGSEFTGPHTVTASQASKCTAGVAAIERSFHPAALRPVIIVDPGTHRASAVAADHCDLGSFLHHGIAENGRNLFHYIVSSNWAEMRAEVGSFHSGIGECMASGISATAAIGPGQGLFYLLDARVFLNLESFGDKEEDQCEHKAETGQDYDSPNKNRIHLSFI